MARVGILGGTFNPPHIGHLICAQEAITQLGLDLVVLMPACEPPHKELDHDPGAEERLMLCKLAVEGDDRLAVSDLEVERGGTSYTVDTLRSLHETAPEDELTLIVGADVAQGLSSWREPAEVISLARIAIATRADADPNGVLDALGELAQSGQIDFFEMVRTDVSSTLIRERLAADEPIRYLVPDAVREQIERHGWYT